jgi:hypothetical protein
MGGGGGKPPDPFFGNQLPYGPYGTPRDAERRLAALEAEVAVLKSQQGTREEFSRWLDKAMSYQTAVMAIAYAGFFILWEKVEGVGHSRLHALAGIFIGLSLSVYIVWTLLQMNVIHQKLVGNTPKPSLEALDRAGPNVFQFSIVTGIAAGLVVLGIWFYRLLA